MQHRRLVGLGQRRRKVQKSSWEQKKWKNGPSVSEQENCQKQRALLNSSKIKIGAHIIIFKHFKCDKSMEKMYLNTATVTSGYFYLHADCKLDFLEPQFTIFGHEGGVGSYHLTDTC